jgi:hypothetical protein
MVKSSSDEIYKKYNISERFIKLIDGDENKIKILLKERRTEELRITPYTKKIKL